MRALPILAGWLHTVALALWLGGLIAIGALVAPSAFHIVRINPGLAGNAALQTQIAGGIVGGSLRAFNVVCYVCGIVLLAANALLWPRLPVSSRRWTLLTLLASGLLLLSALYLGFSLFPRIDAAQLQGNKTLFAALHTSYENISLFVQLPLLLLLALLSTVRDISYHTALPVTQTAR